DEVGPATTRNSPVKRIHHYFFPKGHRTMAKEDKALAGDDDCNDHLRPFDHNGQGEHTDAPEPRDSTGDIDFDPAKLEAEGQTESPNCDLFDPQFLGLSQDFAAEANVAKKWDVIRVEKPTKSRVFRVHPTMRLKTVLLVLKEDNESYLVQPHLR